MRPPGLHKTATRHSLLSMMAEWVLETLEGALAQAQVATEKEYCQTGAREDLAGARAAGRKLDGMGRGSGRSSGMPVWQVINDGRQIVWDCFGTTITDGIEEVSGKLREIAVASQTVSRLRL